LSYPADNIRSEPEVEIFPKNIPEILREQNNWVSFCIEWNAEKEKFTKAPKHGERSNDPSTWKPFDEIVCRIDRHTKMAYALPAEKTDETRLIVIDIDHCFIDGKLNASAARIVQMFAGTYIEKSISGDGVHIFLYGKTGMNGCKELIVDGTGLEIEVYSSRRFIVMTGNLVEGGTAVVLNMQDQLNAVEMLLPGYMPTAPVKPLLTTAPAVVETATVPAKTDFELRKLREALSFLDPTRYADWFSHGIALKRWGDENNRDEEAFALFDEWSKTTKKDNYSWDETATKWNSWDPGEIENGLTVKSIFYAAMQAGYKPSRIRFSHPVQRTDEAKEILSKKAVILPSSKTPIIESAKMIFERLADTRRYFWRGRSVHDISEGCLAPVRANAFRSRIEHLGPTIAAVKIKDEFVFAPRRPSKADCEALLETLEAQTLLPHVELIAEAPVLFRTEAGIVRADGGYCPEAKAYILGEHEPVIITAEEAVKELTDLFQDFHFVTPADKARALAFTLSIGLRLGGFIRDNRCPLFVVEADQSQTGKGTLVDCIAGIYGEHPALVSEKAGGVGGFDESIQQRLIDGKPVISFDNLRGKIASAYLEMLLTAQGRVGCRVPYRGEIYIDPHRFIFCATSNGMSSTKDLANRSVIIRLRKHAVDYRFHRWPEGGLAEHVKANQTRLLAGVHAIIRQWYEGGAPEAAVSGHDFRGWHRIAESIVGMNWPELGPVIDSDHIETLLRISDPARSWLREVCPLVESDKEVTASEIADLCSSNGLAVPSCRDDADEKSRARAVGTAMGRLFEKELCIVIDGTAIIKSERQIKRFDGEGYKPTKFYQFWKGQAPQAAVVPGARTTAQPQNPLYLPEKEAFSDVSSTWCGCAVLR
jgi:hypothetical protein